MKKRIALSVAVAAMASFLLCGCTGGKPETEVTSTSEIASVAVTSEAVSETKSEEPKSEVKSEKPSEEVSEPKSEEKSEEKVKEDPAGKKDPAKEETKPKNDGEMTEEEYAALQKARAEARIPDELKGNDGEDSGLGDDELQLQRARALARMDYVSAVLSGVNQARAEAGLQPLTLDTTLNNLCSTRAQEISTCWGHDRPDGRSCFTILSDNGVSYSTCGENIAAGQETGSEVVNTWMNSEGHRANILNPAYTKMGIGVYLSNDEYGYYWAQIFTD